MSIINQIEERHNKNIRVLSLNWKNVWFPQKKGRGCAFEQEEGGGLKEWDF